MTNRRPAQILLTTLLVLMILGVIIVGVVVLTTRDALETASTKQYEELYNSSESAIFGVIEKYSDPSVSLSELQLTDYPQDCLPMDGYECTFEDPDTGYVTVLHVEDSNELIEYELGKDQLYQMGLAGYRGPVFVSWEGEAALEFGLVYQLGGQTYYIGDLYDQGNLVFDTSGNNPITDPPPENHAFPFQEVIVGDRDNITFDISGITGLPAGATTESLMIKVRMPNDSHTILLNVNGGGQVNFPLQVRRFTATSYAPDNNVDVVAGAETQVPLYPQALSVLFYPLAVSEDITK